VPTGIAVFPNDFRSIRLFADRANPIAHWTEFESGGHFAAIEKPQQLARDLADFFRPLR
jgi:pimeloyl-ACP methyl ester carboxylesterase